MSGSRRKTPIVAMTTATTDKPFKQAEHQRERSKVKAKLKTSTDDTGLPPGKTFGNQWKAAKDGRQYLGGKEERLAMATRIAKGSDAVDAKRVARAFKKLTAK